VIKIIFLIKGQEATFIAGAQPAGIAGAGLIGGRLVKLIAIMPAE